MKYPNKHTAAKWRDFVKHFVLDHIASSFQYRLNVSCSLARPLGSGGSHNYRI
jgi:hypothetical protein